MEYNNAGIIMNTWHWMKIFTDRCLHLFWVPAHIKWSVHLQYDSQNWYQQASPKFNDPPTSLCPSRVHLIPCSIQTSATIRSVTECALYLTSHGTSAHFCAFTALTVARQYLFDGRRRHQPHPLIQSDASVRSSISFTFVSPPQW